MAAETFASYVYGKLLDEEAITEDEYTVDELATAEDVLAIDDLGMDDDALVTYAEGYRSQCEENGVEPDFTGYEDYE